MLKYIKRLKEKMGDATRFAKPETRDARMNICDRCEYLSVVSTCDVCGCRMPTKSRLANARCPLGKWIEEDTQ